MKMIMLVSLLALSLPIATAWRNPFYSYKSYELERRADETAFVFLCNCWATNGARSEVDFFSNYPTNFGNATPEYSTVISPNDNYIWQDGGIAEGPNSSQFKWNITNKNASTNAKAGTATDGGNKYILLRDTDSTLYQATDDGTDYNCIVVYRAQLDSTTVSLPPSTNSTSTSTPDAGGRSTATPSAAPGKSGLSTAAIAGLSVGVVVAVLLIAGAIVFFVLRRRRQRKASRTPTEPLSVYADEKKLPPPGAGPDASDPMYQHMASELHQDTVLEMPDTDPRIVEAGSGVHERAPNTPIEMEASGRYSPQSRI